METTCVFKSENSCVKNFAWSSSMSRSLSEQTYNSEFSMPLMQLRFESIRHALFFCPRVQEVWRLLGMAAVVNEVCMVKREGGSVMADLLLLRIQLRRWLMMFSAMTLLPRLCGTCGGNDADIHTARNCKSQPDRRKQYRHSQKITQERNSSTTELGDMAGSNHQRAQSS